MAKGRRNQKRNGASRFRAEGPAVLLLLVFCVACANSTFDVENRQTPVHVWLTIPELAETGGTIGALVYVGAEKVVEGPIRYPRGIGSVRLPTVYVTAGQKRVSAVFRNGALSANTNINVQAETWVQITIRGRQVLIQQLNAPPNLCCN